MKAAPRMINVSEHSESMTRKETGIQFLARLSSRPSIANLEPAVFGTGPNNKDVIELYGDEGSGKTQMMVHLIANCILSENWDKVKVGGHSAGVIVIETDNKFPILRLVNIMEKRVLKTCEHAGVEAKSEEVENFVGDCLKRLQVIRCLDGSHLLMTLQNMEKYISENLSIAAIFVDTISEFYFTDRGIGGNQKSVQEANMKRVTATLNQLVDTYKVTLFASKSAVFKSKDNIDCTDVMKKDLESEHSEFLCRPWQRFVTHRLILKTLGTENSNQPVFIVGGDCVQGNTKFKIAETGIQFI